MIRKALVLPLVLTAAFLPGCRRNSGTYLDDCIRAKCSAAIANQHFERYQKVDSAETLAALAGTNDPAVTDRMLWDFTSAGHPIRRSHVHNFEAAFLHPQADPAGKYLY